MFKYILSFLVLFAQLTLSAEEVCPPLLTINAENTAGQIVLSDGSKWFVPLFSRWTTQKWQANDQVEISFYGIQSGMTCYTINNLRTKDSVTVSLSKVPEATNDSMWIYALDVEKAEVKLNNGCVFIVQPRSAFFGLTTISPAKLMYYWKVGDIMLILKGEDASFELMNLTFDSAYPIQVKVAAEA